jgi:hypothetical protein
MSQGYSLTMATRVPTCGINALVEKIGRSLKFSRLLALFLWRGVACLRETLWRFGKRVESFG